jgi:putative tricarboxylic transport membrane protein
MTKHLASWQVVLGAVALLGTPAIAQDFTPENPECIAPAGPGGGWDFSCRQVGRVMQDLGIIKGAMQTVNMTGGGGGVAYAETVNKRNENNDLIIAASTATSTRLAQGAYPGNTKEQVRWLGTIGADYGVIVVSEKSDVASLPQLMDQIKADPKSVAFGGASATGGWDHLKVLIAADGAGITNLRGIKYVAFEGAGDAMTQLLGGTVQAITGDLSEVLGFVESGDVRVLAVMAKERLGGALAKFPTAYEQGIEVVGYNWRGFYAPGGMTDAAYDWWSKAIGDVYASAEWKGVMEQSGLAPLDLRGAEFDAFVGDSIDQVAKLSREIGLLK